MNFNSEILISYYINWKDRKKNIETYYKHAKTPTERAICVFMLMHLEKYTAITENELVIEFMKFLNPSFHISYVELLGKKIQFELKDEIIYYSIL